MIYKDQLQFIFIRVLGLALSIGAAVFAVKIFDVEQYGRFIFLSSAVLFLSGFSFLNTQEFIVQNFRKIQFAQSFIFVIPLLAVLLSVLFIFLGAVIGIFSVADSTILLTVLPLQVIVLHFLRMKLLSGQRLKFAIFDFFSKLAVPVYLLVGFVSISDIPVSVDIAFFSRACLLVLIALIYFHFCYVSRAHITANRNISEYLFFARSSAVGYLGFIVIELADRILLKIYFEFEEVAFFSFVSIPGNLAYLFFVSAVFSYVVPELIRSFESNDDTYKLQVEKVYFLSFLMFFWLFLFLIIYSEDVVNILGKPAYFGVANYFPLACFYYYLMLQVVILRRDLLFKGKLVRLNQIVAFAMLLKFMTFFLLVKFTDLGFEASLVSGILSLGIVLLFQFFYMWKKLLFWSFIVFFSYLASEQLMLLELTRFIGPIILFCFAVSIMRLFSRVLVLCR